MDSSSSSDDGSDVEELTDFLGADPVPASAGVPEAIGADPPVPVPAGLARDLEDGDDSNSSVSDGSSNLGEVEDFLEAEDDEMRGPAVAGTAPDGSGARKGGIGADAASDADSDSDSDAEEIVDLDDDGAFGAEAAPESSPAAVAASIASSTGSNRTGIYASPSVAVSQLNILGTEHGDWFAVMQTAFDAAKLSGEQTGRFVGAMTAKDYDDGQAIVVQGDIGDAFYIIESGVVSIEEAKPGEDEPRVLAKLYPGHHFGELSVLSKQPRVASVIARGGSVRCHEMTKSSFDAFSDADKRSFTMVIESLVAETKRKRSNRSKVKASAHTEQLRFVEQQRRDFRLRETVTATRRSADRKEMINEFLVLRKLGSGSFGVVKMATNTVTGETVALKIINKTKLRKRRLGITDEELMREVDVMRRLRNEHVVAMREAINDASHDLLIFVEEFMAMGPVMEEAEACEPLDQSLARVYFRSVLRGLEYLHFQRVVHRDIKPANILVSENGEAKLADFGVAAVLGDGSQTLRDVQGTPAFMAPELFNDDPVYDGFAVDIWALGATLYNLVTGMPPFLASNEFELAEKLRTEAPVFPPGINPHLKHLIMTMLERNVGKRASIPALMKHDWVTIEGTDPMPPIKYVRIVPAKATPAIRALQASARAAGMASSSVRGLHSGVAGDAAAATGLAGVAAASPSAPAPVLPGPAGSEGSVAKPAPLQRSGTSGGRRPRRVRRSSLVGVPSAEAAEAAIAAVFPERSASRQEAGGMPGDSSESSSAFRPTGVGGPSGGRAVAASEAGGIAGAGAAWTGAGAGTQGGLPRRRSVPAMDSGAAGARSAGALAAGEAGGPPEPAGSGAGGSDTRPPTAPVASGGPLPGSPVRVQSWASLKSMRSARATTLTRQREIEDAAKKAHLQQLRRRQMQLLKGHKTLAAKDRDILMEQQRIAIHASRAEAAVESIEIFSVGSGTGNAAGGSSSNRPAPDTPMGVTGAAGAALGGAMASGSAPSAPSSATGDSITGGSEPKGLALLSTGDEAATRPLASPSATQLRFMFGRQASSSSSSIDISGGSSSGLGFDSPRGDTRARSVSGAFELPDPPGSGRPHGGVPESPEEDSVGPLGMGSGASLNAAGAQYGWQQQHQSSGDSPGTPVSGMISPELGAALYGVYSPGLLRSLSRRSSLRVGSSGFSTPMGTPRLAGQGRAGSRRLLAASPTRQDSDSVDSGSFVGMSAGSAVAVLVEDPGPKRRTSDPAARESHETVGGSSAGGSDSGGQSGDGIGCAGDGVGGMLGRGSFLMSTSASAGAVGRPAGARLGRLGAAEPATSEDAAFVTPGLASSALRPRTSSSMEPSGRPAGDPTGGRIPRTASGHSLLARSSSSSDVTRPSLTMRMTARDHGLVVSTQVPDKSWLLQTWSAAGRSARRHVAPLLAGASGSTAPDAAPTGSSVSPPASPGASASSSSASTGHPAGQAPPPGGDASFAPGLRLSVNPSLAESVASRLSGIGSRLSAPAVAALEAPSVASVQSADLPAASAGIPADSEAAAAALDSSASWRPSIRRRSLDMPPLPRPVLLALAGLSAGAERAAAMTCSGLPPLLPPTAQPTASGSDAMLAGASACLGGGAGSDAASIVSSLASAAGMSEAAASVGSSSIVLTQSRTLRRAKDFVMVTEHIDNDDSGGLVRKAVIFHSKGNSLSLATTNREAVSMRSLKRSSSRGKNALKLRVDASAAAEAGVGDGLTAVEEAADEAETPSNPESRRFGASSGKSPLGAKGKGGRLGMLGGTGATPGGSEGNDDDDDDGDDDFDGDSDDSDSSSLDSDMLDMQGAEEVTDNLDSVLGELLEAPSEDAEVAALEDIMDDGGDGGALDDAADLDAEGVDYDDSDEEAEAAGAPGWASSAAAGKGPVSFKCPTVLTAPVPAEVSGGVRVGPRWPGVMQPSAAQDHTNTGLGLRFGAAEDQGRRDGMEDRLMALADVNAMLGLEGDVAPQAYFGVYDGHMGQSTSAMLAERLHLAVVEELGTIVEAGGDPVDALRAAFERTDREWVHAQVTTHEKDQTAKFSGATAIVAMVREEEIIIVEDETEAEAEAEAAAASASSAGKGASSAGTAAATAAGSDEDEGGERKRVRLLYVANAGDCRAVLCQGGWAVDLSTDHKASLESEKVRVEAAGGSVHNGRVNGVIAVTRAFGDPEFKALKDKAWWGGSFTDDVLTATPDVRSQEITPYDEFVVMACDGVWDVMTSQQAVNFVRRRLREEPDVQAATEALVAKAIQLASVDNVSAIVVALNQLPAASSSGSKQPL